MKPSRPKKLPPEDIPRRLDEAEEFFMKTGPVHNTLQRLAARLAKEGIPYAVVGGMALNLHGYERMTRDVDVLMTAEGLERFTERCVGLGYVPSFAGARTSFRDTESGTPIEILVTGDFPGDGKPGPVSFPDPASSAEDRAGVRVIAVERLIEMKLASGLSAAHRLRDLADVQDLIRILDLPRDLEDTLDMSVRAKYRELWTSVNEAS